MQINICINLGMQTHNILHQCHSFLKSLVQFCKSYQIAFVILCFYNLAFEIEICHLAVPFLPHGRNRENATFHRIIRVTQVAGMHSEVWWK